MRTSANGRAFIEQWEGLSLKAYNDGVGVCTIGYGHTTAAGPPSVAYGMTCTVAQADAWLAADLSKVESSVNSLVKVSLTQPQFDTLVSFQFNTGGLGRSTLLRKLNTGDYTSVPSELARWNRGGGKVMLGLTRRRAAEGKLWVSSSTETQMAPGAQGKPVGMPTGHEAWWVAALESLLQGFLKSLGGH